MENRRLLEPLIAANCSSPVPFCYWAKRQWWSREEEFYWLRGINTLSCFKPRNFGIIHRRGFFGLNHRSSLINKILPLFLSSYFQDLEGSLLEGLHPAYSCKSLFPLFLKVNAKGLTGHQFTPPWSVLDLMKGARTHAREIQVDPWCVNLMESSSSRVLYRGEADVLTEGIMASMPGSVT